VVYRIFVAMVVAFWLVMSGLLMRMELSPERNTFLNVPVSHVVKLMFFHEQPSVLSIDENGQRIGSFLLRPKNAEGRRELHFSGNIALGLPWNERQRISWNGKLEMGKQFEVQTIELGFGTRESEIDAHFSVDVRDRLGHYEVRREREVLQRGSFRLNELRTLAQQEDINLALMQDLQAPKIVARPTKMRIGNEEIEAYLITVAREKETLARIYVSQLGQVLKVTTSFGYSLAAEEISP
jgi:hypothetical protein